MEQMLDLPVQSVPLRHLTKSRIRNNSRKILLPSKNHLKRNLIGQSIYSEQSHYRSTVTETSVDMSSNEDVRLKLPPPPVAKKPKVNLLSLSAKKSPNLKENAREEDELHGSKEKPAIAPKPGTVLSTTSTCKEINNNHDNRVVDLKLNSSAYDKQMSETVVKDLNSPTRSSMTFSERLKASSLSRRKEANMSDGSQGQFRSQIISPIRRGSRSFLNSDSIMDSSTKPKPVSSVFRRYSSETNVKLVETHEVEYGKDLKEDFDLEQFKDLTLEAVDPVAVDSVLSTNKSFEEDDVIKDSFDSDELFKFGNTIAGSRDAAMKNFELMPSRDTNIDSVISSKNLSHNEIQTQEQNQTISHSKPELNPTVYFENGERNRQLASMDMKQRQQEYMKNSFVNSSSTENTTQVENLTEFSPRSIKNSNEDQANSVNNASKATKTFEQSFDNEKAKPSQTLKSPRKFGKGKDRANIRRKFRPISIEEVTSYSKITSKRDTGSRNLEADEPPVVSLGGSLDTDSSLEHVTQDIELDSTFEIPLQLTSTLALYDGMNFKQSEGFDDEEGLIFMPDSSSSPPLIAQEESRSDGLKLNVSSQMVGASNERITGNEFSQVLKCFVELIMYISFVFISNVIHFDL